MNAYKRIGIIAAMEVEADLLIDALQNKVVQKIAGSEYNAGMIGKHEVIVVQCGIGKVSAAISTQILIDEYAPDCIINTGCAGALEKSLAVGDMVIASETAEWDMDMLALGFPRGYISSLDSVRMLADDEIKEELSKHIPQETKIVTGLVVSGDQFVSRPEQREAIFSAFPDALCAEMEGAALGHVCSQNDIPFCVMRCMSDTADGSSEINFFEFAKMAGQRSAEILLSYLNE